MLRTEGKNSRVYATAKLVDLRTRVQVRAGSDVVSDQAGPHPELLCRVEEIVGGTFFGPVGARCGTKEDPHSETSSLSQSLAQERRRDSVPKEREEEVLFLAGKNASKKSVRAGGGSFCKLCTMRARGSKPASSGPHIRRRTGSISLTCAGLTVGRRFISMEIVGTLLRLAVMCSVFGVTSYVEGAVELPSGVCYWRQGSLINNIPTGATKDLALCRFVVRDPDFLDILGSSPKLVELVKTNAHEGGVWYPDQNEFYFTSGRLTGPDGNARADLKKVNLETGAVTVLNSPTYDVPNGMVLDNEGNLLVCQQGNETEGGFIQRINLKSLNRTVVADNWFGVPFNSPNDVVVKTDGSVWITDPSYGNVQGFRTAPKVNNQVYRISASGVVDAVADGFTQPNGLAFSKDEKRLYVTDTGFATGVSGQFDVAKPHSITVFDVGDDGFLFNRRLFASVGVYDGSAPGLGIPDGIKVDTKDRVYIASVDGIQVFAKSGKPLGLIRQPGTSNMGFAGKGLDTLYLLNDTTISYVTLKAKAAGLTYASTAVEH